MIIECCSQERSYQRFYGLLGERFCHLEEKWVEKFDTAFQEQVSERKENEGKGERVGGRISEIEIECFFSPHSIQLFIDWRLIS